VSRRGWVSVRDPANQWWLLSVYDDGWCVAPVDVPTTAGSRRQVRALLAWMVAVVGLFTAAVAVGFVLPSVGWLPWVLLAASLVTLAVAGVQAARRRAASRPPTFGSAAEHASSVAGAQQVGLGSVRSVTVHREGHEDVVTVALRKGRPLGYRSPDRTLGRLFAPWVPAPPSS
jgi:anti-sigma factor RsiW